MSVLVLGLGNILLRDEGAGVRLVERLLAEYRLPPGVEALDGGTSGMEMLYEIADRSQLIVCDAILSDAPPGTLIRLTGDEVPAFFQTRLSPHQLGLSDVLATLQLLDRAPAGVTLLGLVPADLELGIELSEVVAAALEPALEALVGELRSLGIEPDAHVGTIPEPASTPDGCYL